ncbi:hypothetical protein LCGC14_1515340 [marine sediment metagenome]|uniref:Uncharacterized protein n=1 Tax=marine sediment metagenome TaxID=412755 RepID=A0A0F9J0E9_9ZZZZ
MTKLLKFVRLLAEAATSATLAFQRFAEVMQWRVKPVKPATSWLVPWLVRHKFLIPAMAGDVKWKSGMVGHGDLVKGICWATHVVVNGKLDPKGVRATFDPATSIVTVLNGKNVKKATISPPPAKDQQFDELWVRVDGSKVRVELHQTKACTTLHYDTKQAKPLDAWDVCAEHGYSAELSNDCETGRCVQCEAEGAPVGSTFYGSKEASHVWCPSCGEVRHRKYMGAWHNGNGHCGLCDGKGNITARCKDCNHELLKTGHCENDECKQSELQPCTLHHYINCYTCVQEPRCPKCACKLVADTCVNSACNSQGKPVPCKEHGWYGGCPDCKDETPKPVTPPKTCVHCGLKGTEAGECYSMKGDGTHEYDDFDKVGKLLCTICKWILNHGQCVNAECTQDAYKNDRCVLCTSILLGGKCQSLKCTKSKGGWPVCKTHGIVTNHDGTCDVCESTPAVNVAQALGLKQCKHCGLTDNVVDWGAGCTSNLSMKHEEAWGPKEKEAAGICIPHGNIAVGCNACKAEAVTNVGKLVCVNCSEVFKQKDGSSCPQGHYHVGPKNTYAKTAAMTCKKCKRVRTIYELEAQECAGCVVEQHNQKAGLPLISEVADAMEAQGSSSYIVSHLNDAIMVSMDGQPAKEFKLPQGTHSIGKLLIDGMAAPMEAGKTTAESIAGLMNTTNGKSKIAAMAKALTAKQLTPEVCCNCGKWFVDASSPPQCEHGTYTESPCVPMEKAAAAAAVDSQMKPFDPATSPKCATCNFFMKQTIYGEFYCASTNCPKSTSAPATVPNPGVVCVQCSEPVVTSKLGTVYCKKQTCACYCIPLMGSESVQELKGYASQSDLCGKCNKQLTSLEVVLNFCMFCSPLSYNKAKTTYEKAHGTYVAQSQPKLAGAVFYAMVKAYAELHDISYKEWRDICNRGTCPRTLDLSELAPDRLMDID